MTGDYIKQLQLKKQIEQKAKEAAKSRETAEEKLAQAEESLKIAKRMDAPSAEAEKHLTEASSFFKDKDYRSSLSLSTKSIESSQKAEKEKIGSMLASADELRMLVERQGTKTEDCVVLSQETKAALTKGSLEEAFVMAKNLWDKVEKLINRYMATSFGEAQTIMLLAEGLGIKVETERQSLVEAREALEQEQVPASMEKLASCLEALDASLKERFTSRVETLNEISSNQLDVALDLSKVDKTLKKAQDLLAQRSYEESFAALFTAETEKQKALTRGFTSELQSLRKRCTALKENGVEIKDVNAQIALQRDLLKDEKFEEALEGIGSVKNLLREKETGLLTDVLLKLRPKMLIAKRLGIDLTLASKDIETARASLVSSNIREALDLVASAEAKIEDTLKGLPDLELELSRTRSAMRSAESLRLDTSSAKSYMDSARRATLSHEFVSAAGLLKEAQMELSKQLEENYAKDVMAIEIKFASAVRIGADVAEETSILEKIVELIKKGDFTVAPELLAKCSDSTDAKLRYQVQNALDGAQKSIEAYSSFMDVCGALGMLDQARAALGKKEYVTAFDMAGESAESLKRDEKQALETKLTEARTMLTILKELNCESVTLKDKMLKAEEMRGNNLTMQALRTANDVIQFSRSIMMDELTREMATISRSISVERKKGVEVMKPEHLLEEAGKALKVNAFDKAYENLKEAGISLKQLSSVHVEIYDRIVEISNLLEEADAQGIDTRKATDLLLRTKRMFESGRYADARATSTAAYAETEGIVAPFMASRKVQEAKELVLAMDNLGLDTAAAQASILTASELEERNDHLTALKTINSGIDSMRSRLAGGISREIATCRTMMDKTRAGGIDVSSAQQILLKAISLQEEKRFLDALRATQMARGELEQLMLMEQKATDQIDRTMATLKAIQDLGVNVSPAMEIMNQARIIQKQGNHPLAMELSKRAVDQAAHLMDMMASRKRDEIDLKLRRDELEGPELVIVDRIRRDMSDRISQRRFRDVLPLIHNYEEELTKVRAIRDMAQRTLSEVRSKFDEAAAAGISSEELRQLFSKADERMEARAFAEASAMAMHCLDELSHLREMFETRMTELQTLRHDFQYLDESDDQANIGSLLDQADEALLALDFERSSLFLRRAKAQMQETVGRESGRNYEELMALYKLLNEIGYDRSKLPPSVMRLHEAKGGAFGSKDLEALNEGVHTLRQVLIVEFGRKRKKVAKEIEKAKRSGLEVNVSEGLYTSATGGLMTQNIGEAYRTLEQCERSIGTTSAADDEFRKLRTKLMSELETARANGTLMVSAEHLIKQADALLAIDTRQALEILNEAQTKIEEQKQLMMPDIGIDIDFLDEPKKGSWAKVQLHVSNDGIAVAREINIDITGDVEVKGITGIDRLLKGEKRMIEASIRPKSTGKMLLKLILACKPITSEELVGFESEFDITVD